MAIYEIKKGIPISKSKQGVGSGSKWPWGEMVVGDCIEIPLTESGFPKSSPYSSLKFYNTRHEYSIRITCRTIKEENIVRVWRIE